jgi:hypothetical protein
MESYLTYLPAVVVMVAIIAPSIRLCWKWLKEDAERKNKQD